MIYIRLNSHAQLTFQQAEHDLELSQSTLNLIPTRTSSHTDALVAAEAKQQVLQIPALELVAELLQPVVERVDAGDGLALPNGLPGPGIRLPAKQNLRDDVPALGLGDGVLVAGDHRV